MRKIKIITITWFVYFSFLSAHGQVYYDNHPTTVPSNANILDHYKEEMLGPVANFAPIGTQWNNRILTYFFQNVTGDIAANDARNAVR